MGAILTCLGYMKVSDHHQVVANLEANINQEKRDMQRDMHRNKQASDLRNYRRVQYMTNRLHPLPQRRQSF
jgi:hypothetical protein